MQITWLGHATFLIETAKHTIYIDPYLDPYSTLKLPKATVILISHWHPDHCTRESVERLLVDSTKIFGTAEVASEFLGAKTMLPNEQVAIPDLSIKAMPTKHDRGGHEEGVIGFLIEADQKKLYYTSDTKLLPEMKSIRPDVVLIPVGGITTMKPKEAAEAVHLMEAKLAIPAHWGTLTGTRDNAELFKEYTEQKHHQVVILEPGQMVQI